MEISAVLGAGFAVLILIILIGVGPTALWVWGIIDAATRPDWAFERARFGLGRRPGAQRPPHPLAPRVDPEARLRARALE